MINEKIYEVNTLIKNNIWDDQFISTNIAECNTLAAISPLGLYSLPSIETILFPIFIILAETFAFPILTGR